MMPRVFDDVMPDPLTYRAAALALPFGDLTAGPVTFHGMVAIGPNPVSALLEAELGLRTTFAAFRLSPEGQEEPHYIHTDRDMGDWTAIYYLNPDPPAGDGTTFWRSRVTGATQSAADGEALLEEWLAWRDQDQWEPWQTVAAVFNRLLLFPSAYFHSRALAGNWGHGPEARLIQLAFGTGDLP
jgi:hypothetical protein